MIRAELPLAYSQGFNPHPKLAFSPALAVGVAGEAEYLDAGFSEPFEVSMAIERLNAVVPAGLEVTAGLVLPSGVKVPSLGATIAVADYRIAIEGIEAVEIEKALTAQDIVATKMNGEQTGPTLLEASEDDDVTYVSVRVPIRIKPLAVIADAMGSACDVSQMRAVIDRLALWVIVDGRLADPLMAVGSFK